MIPLIDQHREAIERLCQEYGVVRLEVFGSAATGAFDPGHSDIDFIVTYPPDYEYGPWLARFFEFRDRRSALLGRPVDLIMASALRKPRFIEAVNETRQVLYAA